LIDVARHLQAALRRSDTVARLGDERFGLILNQISAFEARRLMYTLWRSLSWSEETVGLVGELAGQVTFTAGVAVFPGDATDGPELLTRAEIALDVARATSQRRVLLYAETCGDSGVDVHGTDLRWHRVQSAAREEPE
jgi:diguanylate cyclase (GGDEF)-like protein